MNPTDNPPAPATPPRGVLAWLRAHATDAAVGLALAVVVGCTGFVSYTHICALTLELHQSWKTAHLAPLYIDGQIVIGSFVWARVPGRAKWCGLAGIVPGLTESLYANWESGIVHGTAAAGWATVAAQSFAVSSFLFELWLTARKTALGRAGEAGEVTTEAALRLLLSSGSQRAIAAVLGVERAHVQRWARQLAEAADPDTGEVPVAALNGAGAGG